MTSNIHESVIFGKNITLGENVTIKAGCILEDNVTLGNNVYVDFGSIIHSNVLIDDRTTIGARCILGEYVADFYADRINKIHTLHIGKESLIRSETIIYGDNDFGNYLQTGHRVTIREQSKIGNHVRIGTLSDIQGHCEIQDYVNLHSNVHIGQKSLIKKYAWIFPYVVLTNDPAPPSDLLVGVTIEEFAVVATGTVILPGKNIGQGALIGAGSVVTKDIGENMVAFGNPAKEHGTTDRIKDGQTGMQIYPWKYSFDRGMPWENIGYKNWLEEQ